MKVYRWVKILTITSLLTTVGSGLSGMGLASMAQAESHVQKMTVEADEALEWRRDDRLYIARGNAVVTTKDMVLKADIITAEYMENAETGNNRVMMMTGDGNADVLHQDVHGIADHITYNRNTDVLIMTRKNDTSILRVTRGDDISEAEERIIYNRADGIITSIGNTFTALSDGREMRGEKSVTTLKDDGKTVDHIVIKGNVSVIQPLAEGGTQQATGQKAVYNATTDIVIVTGDVVLLQKDNVIRGGKAVMRIGEGQSVVTPDENTSRVSGQFFMEDEDN